MFVMQIAKYPEAKRTAKADEIKSMLGLGNYYHVMPRDVEARLRSLDLSKDGHIGEIVDAIASFGPKSALGTSQIAEEISRWVMLKGLHGTKAYDKLFTDCTKDVCELSQNPTYLIAHFMFENGGDIARVKVSALKTLESAFGKLDRKSLGALMGANTEVELMTAIVNAYIDNGVKMGKVVEQTATCLIKVYDYHAHPAANKLMQQYPPTVMEDIEDRQRMVHWLIGNPLNLQAMHKEYVEYCEKLKKEMETGPFFWEKPLV